VRRFPLLYDIVNVGREVLDKFIANSRFAALQQSASAQEVRETGAMFLDLLSDADELLCTDDAFALRPWVQAAQGMSRSNGTEDLAAFYDKMARAQVTTWMPACDDVSELENGNCSAHTPDNVFLVPSLEDYANKAWGGVVGSFYAGRVACYIFQAAQDFDAGLAEVNAAEYHRCVDRLSRDFQGDTNEVLFPLCSSSSSSSSAAPNAINSTNERERNIMLSTKAAEEVVSISMRLLEKYEEELST